MLSQYLLLKKVKKELEEDEGTMSASDLVVNEIDETLGNPKSNEKEKVGDDVVNAKRASSKNSNSAVKLKTSLVKIDTPFPQRLKKKKKDMKFLKLFYVFNSLFRNVLLIEAITKMPWYAKFMKEFVTKKLTL